MKVRYRLIVFFLLIVLVLCAVNIYLTLAAQRSPHIQEMVTAQVKQQLLAQPLPQTGPQGIQGIAGVNGKDGRDGVSTVTEKQTLVREIITKPEKGDKGEPGDKGKDARQVILSTDPDTGDVIWKYEGDTLWNLLIEKCELKGNCEE